MATVQGVGIGVSAARPRASAALARAQVRRRRNEDWRIDHEHGRPDPVTGRIEPRPVALIAALYGVSDQAVRDGIATARALRKAILDHAATDH
jgi:hypothetical protein